ERLLPKGVTDDSDCGSARLVIRPLEPASQGRVNTQGAEYPGGADNAAHGLRLLTPEIGRLGDVRAQLRERGCLIADVETVRRGERLAIVGPELDDPVRLRVGERLYDEDAQGAEHRGSRTDSDRERDHGDQRESGLFRK